MDTKRNDWRDELLHQIRTVFSRAVTDTGEQNILRQWSELKHTHVPERTDFETFQKYRALQDELNNSRIFVKTLPEFVLALRCCGYTSEDIEEELIQCHDRIRDELPNNTDIAGYGIQVTVTEGPPKAYTFQPHVIFPEDLDAEVYLPDAQP